MKRLRELWSKVERSPDSMRLAGLSAWRGKERGLAVFAGVFLATLVITTVFAYGIGLSQIFFQTSLENDPYDAKIDLDAEPWENNSGRTNDTVLFSSICDELMSMDEVADCAMIYGRQGIRTTGFFDREFGRAQPLNIESLVSPEGNWENVSLSYPEALESGPPINGDRIVRIAGAGLYDGEFRERHEEQILYGSWPTPENAVELNAVVLPSQLANQAGARVNHTIDEITISYVTESIALPGEIEDCSGTIQASAMEYLYCREEMTIRNMTVVGIYEEWIPGNPTLLFNPIFISDSALTDSQKVILMDNDHGYLGIAVDRSQLPTSSTSEAADWLTDLGEKISDKNYTSEELEIVYTDISGGSIIFLNIFLGLIQVFDYIIMIPIVILSISVLIYGLILSLEQRRREVSINRVMGATALGLQRMVLLEIFVISLAGWFAGYFLAMWLTPLVLDAVGFMSFRTGDFEVDPSLSLTMVLSVAMLTIGLALLFGRSRTKEYLDLEIEEGVRKVVKEREPRRWLHWLMLGIGILAMIESWIEDEEGLGPIGPDGLLENFFIDGMVLVFGPFLLWIGGALVLARVGASGPRIMRTLLGRTPLLKDVRRGLSTSGSSEAIYRLAVIMLLTLSIVTLAAVQGFTGTLVDERTSSLQTGSDIQVQFNVPLTENETRDALATAFTTVGLSESADVAMLTTVPLLLTNEQGEDTNYLTWVLMENNDEVLMWDSQAVPGNDLQQFQDAISSGYFTSGRDVSRDIDAPDSKENRERSGSGEWQGDAEEEFALTLEYNEINIVMSNDTEEEELDPMLLFSLLESDNNMSHMDFSNDDFSGRDLGMFNLTMANFSGADLSGANLSGAVLVLTDLRGANLSGANLSGAAILAMNPENPMENFMQGANLTGANLTGAWGIGNLFPTIQSNETICPSGEPANESGCSLEFDIPFEIAMQMGSGMQFELDIVTRNATVKYAGIHTWVPGLSSAEATQALIIGEATWRQLVGEEAATSLNQTKWFINLGSLADENDGNTLRLIRAALEADTRVSSVIDWSSTHRDVERNGGLIFGTPGLLSLQFVVASLASIASAFVFLSLVLSQKKKDLAILQAIGASPNQVIRLTLFEILSIVLVSMVLGVILGVGISRAFNGFFAVFGFIFQIFGGTNTPINRDLIWPWWELLLINGTVMLVVVVALFFTTRRALKADLSMVLKGE